MKCPVCGSDHITHSYRRGMEKMYRYVYPRTPYRCKECWSRFWVFENPLKTLASRVVAGVSAALLLMLVFWPLISDDPDKPGLKPEPETVEVGPVPEPNSRSSHLAASRNTRADGESPAEDRPSMNPVPLPEETAGSPFAADAPKRPETATDSPETPPASVLEADPSPQTETTSTSVPETDPSPQPEAPGYLVTRSGGNGDPPAETESPSAAETEALSSSEEAAPSLEAEAPVPETAPEKPENVRSEPLVASASPDSEPRGIASPVEESPSENVESPEPDAPEARTEAAPPEAKPAIRPEPVKRPVKQARPRPSAARQLTGIMPKTIPDGFELFIGAEGGITEYRSFFLKTPPKLVVDIQGNWERKTRSVIEVENERVERVRVGEHPEFIRVVLDLTEGETLKPVFSETPEGLRISLRRKPE